MLNLQAWHDFFLLTGTAAATLLGLVFVSASIAATIPNEKLGDERMRGLWVLPIVYAFVRVLVVSAVGVVPGLTGTSFGYVLATLAVLDLGRMVRVARGMHEVHSTRERFSASDWGWYVLYPAGCTVTLAVTGAGLAAGWPWLPVQLLAAGLLGHMVVGVHNAWELADWLATRQ
jgi:hypothetical protein